jgi:midasin
MGTQGGNSSAAAAAARQRSLDDTSSGDKGADSAADLERQTGASGRDNSEQHATGKSIEADAKEGTSSATNQDPNPHRALTDDALIDEWDRRLNMLTQGLSASVSPESGNLDEDEAIAENGLFEFVNGDENEGKNGRGPSAIGAATEEQHRALLERDDEDEQGTDGERDDLQPDNKVDTADDAVAEPSKRTSAANGTAPCIDVQNGMEDTAIADADENEDGEEDAAPPDSGEISTVANALDVLEARAQRPADLFHMDLAAGRCNAMDVAKDEEEDIVHTENSSSRLDESLAPFRYSGVTKLDDHQAIEFWKRLEGLTSANAASLCEQLRLVLEPTMATGLAGDFRTGKRLNMRRVIEFVASDFRRDRIWLRRVRPEKRSYDVLIAIDDSESMTDSGAGPLALEALSLLTSSLARLEVGRVAVATFGAETELIRGFDEPLPMDDQAGGRLLSSFSFSQKSTDVKKLLDFMLEQMTGPAATSGVNIDEVKLAFVVSDGRLSEREEIRRRIRELQSARVLVAFVVVDIVSDSRKGIFDVQRVEYEASNTGKVKVTPYMDQFPVEFYSVIRDVAILPLSLADALRQWFEIVSNST